MYILYNKNYANKSIYGAGYFPYWVYVKYFGKPMFKLGKKLKFNTYFSLMLSHILGAVAHSGFFINGFTYLNCSFFIVSMIIFPFIFLNLHKKIGVQSNKS